MTQQLNALFSVGKEQELRDQLYADLRPLYPGIVTLRSTIDFECTRGLQIEKYITEAQKGNLSFCGGCKEPTCCTISDPVGLSAEDIARIEEHGHKDFHKPYNQDGIKEALTIKHTAPCQFLQDDKCTIYDYRPYVCHRYPMNVDAKSGLPVFLLMGNCNIGFNILKRQITDSLTTP